MPTPEIQDAASIYSRFYENHGTPEANRALLIGGRVLHFNRPSQLGHAVHVIVQETMGHEPANRARPLDHKGQAYDNFGYDPSGFSVFTTDGQSIQNWRTQHANARSYKLLNGIDRLLIRDGVPIYERDVRLYLELQHEESGQRAWLEVERANGEGIFKLEDGSVGWILGEPESEIERAFVLPPAVPMIPEYEYAA